MMLALTFLLLCQHAGSNVQGVTLERARVRLPKDAVGFAGGCFFIAQLIYWKFNQAYQYFIAVITLLCVAWQLWWVLPYTRLWPTEVKTVTKGSEAQRVRILTGCSYTKS